ncbi:MAG: hypothetical protein D6798_17825 [Deltaproteobacteria bacterium]|nr:MAG: hypothetical protein D6798_17825 [Deltaproteobacteria bacterium]
MPSQPLLQAAPEAPAAAADPEAGYVRPPGVLVDVHALGGRSYREMRDVIGEQLGDLIEVVPLAGGGGQEMRFERGRLRVVEDRIYMVAVPLPSPMRRTDALVALGFPAQADRYVILHREYRLNNAWGFRRIRLKRVGPDTELVREVEAWQEVPGEPAAIR